MIIRLRNIKIIATSAYLVVALLIVWSYYLLASYVSTGDAAYYGASILLFIMTLGWSLVGLVGLMNLFSMLASAVLCLALSIWISLKYQNILLINSSILALPLIAVVLQFFESLIERNQKSKGIVESDSTFSGFPCAVEFLSISNSYINQIKRLSLPILLIMIIVQVVFRNGFTLGNLDGLIQSFPNISETFDFYKSLGAPSKPHFAIGRSIVMLLELLMSYLWWLWPAFLANMIGLMIAGFLLKKDHFVKTQILVFIYLAYPFFFAVLAPVLFLISYLLCYLFGGVLLYVFKGVFYILHLISWPLTFYLHTSNDLLTLCLRLSLVSVIAYGMMLVYRIWVARTLPGACESGNSRLVMHLLQKGANANQENKQGLPALYLAVLNGSTEIVRLLVAAEANPDVHAYDGTTALMSAAERGYTEIVGLLIQAKADVNARQKYGNTALLLATGQGHAEVVKLLIAAKADLSAQNDDGLGWPALTAAAAKNYLEIVKLFLQAKTDVNALGKDGTTALMNAAERGNIEVVRLLIQAKADLNAKDKEGRTALMYATARDRAEVVTLLIAAKARK